MFSNAYLNKKVLVTGHTGFKGSWLACWLKKLGANVIGYALAPNTNPNHFELIQAKINSYINDIRNNEKLKQIIHLEKPDIIFHLAAQPLVRDSYLYPLETFNTNVIGTANLLNSCRGIENVRAVVVVTTDKCYENKEWVWGYRENDPMGGYDPYSASKGCSELVTSSFRMSYFNPNQYGKSHQTLIASVRGGNVIGGGDWSKDRLVPDIIKATVKGEEVSIRNPNATRPWQHVLECLSGYLTLGQKLLEREKSFGEAWNFAANSDSETTVFNVLSLMQEYWPKIKYTIDQNKDNPHEANLLKLDCSKAYTQLKWKSLWNIQTTVEKTIQWYKAFYENNQSLTEQQIDAYVKEILNK